MAAATARFSSLQGKHAWSGFTAGSVGLWEPAHGCDRDVGHRENAAKTQEEQTRPPEKSGTTKTNPRGSRDEVTRPAVGGEPQPGVKYTQPRVQAQNTCTGSDLGVVERFLRLLRGRGAKDRGARASGCWPSRHMAATVRARHWGLTRSSILPARAHALRPASVAGPGASAEGRPASGAAGTRTRKAREGWRRQL